MYSIVKISEGRCGGMLHRKNWNNKKQNRLSPDKIEADEIKQLLYKQRKRKSKYEHI